MKPHEVKVGMRVLLGRLGAGTVVDDYWRGRDRFKVRLDNGKELDFCASSLKAAPLPVADDDGDDDWPDLWERDEFGSR